LWKPFFIVLTKY